MEETIFTKIINGEIPCYKVYEDDKTFAFLDIHPKQPGHTLVIPKNPVPFVWDLPDDDYAALMATVKKVANRIQEILGKRYVGEHIVGVDVPHAHVHLFPFDTNQEYSARADSSKEPDHEALSTIAKKLAF